jgi:uncharacterized damage-inducible protein DinB
MSFTIAKTFEILEQTPDTLINLTSGLSQEWIKTNEGGETWSVFDVVGHLLHGDKTDWLKRVKVILSDSDDKRFTPFDRFAQLETSKGKTLTELLKEFKEVRKSNLTALRALNISEADLSKTGIHPTFGTVTLKQLISTWAVHDLDHLSQISRVMAKQYKDETGPWVEFLKILKQ